MSALARRSVDQCYTDRFWAETSAIFCFGYTFPVHIETASKIFFAINDDTRENS